MRMLSKVIAGAAVLATAVSLAAGPAMADPVNSKLKPVLPKSFDVVGTGSDTIQSVLDQLSINYNSAHKTHNKSHPWVYSWDAVNPKTGALGDLIKTKDNCKKIARPNGSSAGIATLAASIKNPKGGFCEDFGRSSRGRATGDPVKGKGGILFVALAKDAVTWSTLAKGSHAPRNLTTKQLHDIYMCTVKQWGAVGGTKGAKIKPILPQPASGTRAFFLAQINITTPGPCVTASNNSIEENEGTNKIFKNNKNVIFPFSVGKFVAQGFHSAKCGKKPTKGQNLFGCNQNGVLALRKINGKSPTVGSGKNTKVNAGFSAAFVRTVYDVVRFSTATKDHIPANEEAIFGHKGWFCTNKTAKTDITNYGFLTTPLCGLGF
jgi:ABC-type phosphate transport system substrate-binding protein